MDNKIRQITDRIHGAIYVSALEYQMMATPFFYRLHDVYQSSTVYMTFPSNRTKRYEHSLGTMELAGQLFYSAVNNASSEYQRSLLRDLQAQFEVILNSFKNRAVISSVRIYQADANALSRLIPQNKCTMREVLNLIENVGTSPLMDRALCKQEVCFGNLLNPKEQDSIIQLSLYSFLYQSALQALRIASLFHDIGHPPFSHIIEFTLKRLYTKDTSQYVTEKLEKLTQCLDKYIHCNAVEPLLLDGGNAISKEKERDLHEQIGLNILYNAYRGVLSKTVTKLAKNTSNQENRLYALYLVTVIEFTFGILLEKSPVFASLHKIIAGPVDADRLDYTVRDTRNSGVDWGSAPYTRIISASRFAYKDGDLKLAFPEQSCEDIDDLLVNRYKIFQRINYHHKSVKTSELMQRTVEMLAEDYLLSPPGQEIIPEIRDLWESLGAAFGLDEAENQISQWTDSWLVSVLSKALCTLSDSDNVANLIDVSIGRTEEKLHKLYRMLEEVQLNRKRYFPLLKRQRDALKLRDKVVAVAGITEKALDILSLHEYNKLIKETGEKADSAREALYRIGLLKEEVLHAANFGLLDALLPDERTSQELIDEILQDELQQGHILDYFIWKNTGIYKFGVSELTDIFLHRRGGDVYRYDLSTSLISKLDAQRMSCLWLFSFVCFPDLPDVDIEKQIDNIFCRIATSIGNSIHNQMNALFDFDTVVGSVMQITK